MSIVGGEPLVRFRELGEILPRLASMGIYSAARDQRGASDSARNGSGFRACKIVVSIDGLQPEHDERRNPATYDRILKHIKGHQITVHCTVTRQQSRRDGYLDEFVRFWSNNPDTQQIWISLYTPQIGEQSEERLTPADRERVVAALMHLRKPVSEAAHAGRIDQGVRAAAGESRRLHLRADDDLRVGGLPAADRAVPVRRERPIARTAAASPRPG